MVKLLVIVMDKEKDDIHTIFLLNFQKHINMMLLLIQMSDASPHHYILSLFLCFIWYINISGKVTNKWIVNKVKQTIFTSIWLILCFYKTIKPMHSINIHLVHILILFLKCLKSYSRCIVNILHFGKGLKLVMAICQFVRCSLQAGWIKQDMGLESWEWAYMSWRNNGI